MVLSEKVGFDPSELLIDDGDDPMSRRSINVLVDQVIDEDGDDALNIELRSHGLSWAAITQILVIATNMAAASAAEEDEDDD